MQKLMVGLLVSAWLFLMIPASYAFRADEPINANSTPAALQAAVQRAPTTAQLAALKLLPQVNIVWDGKTGAPLSMRGRGLAAVNLGGKGLALGGKADFSADAVAVLDHLTAAYRIRNAPEEFSAYRVDTDELGFHHVRLKQMCRGLRVVGGELLVHFGQDGAAYQVNGRYIPEIDIDTKPLLDAAAAVAAAKTDLTARGKPRSDLHGTPELVVYAEDAAPVLAYELTLIYQDIKFGPGCWRYWVNARTGARVCAYDDIRKAAPAAPSAQAEISGKILAGEGGGTWSLNGYYDGALYYLYNTNLRWQIYNAAASGYTDNDATAWRSTSNWGDSDPTEFSAAANFNLTQTYYNHVHSRNSYDNSNTIAFAYVHFPGGYDNAFWSPTFQKFFFLPGQTLGELTVLDVVAHEYTHAITDYTAALVYRNESGALNESFSDVFGAIVEFEGQPDGRSAYPDKAAGQADWLLAEDCSISATAMRDMRNPQRYNQPSKYLGTYWYSGTNDNGGVHINSGVQNHFFYLLCEGGNGNNDGISYNLTGIEVQNARLIAYRALTSYSTPNTDYTAVRTAWISAAQDLNASWVAGVEAAWAAVGVGTASSTNSYGRPLGLNNDFDGDNITDYALYDYANGKWYIWSSLNNSALAWGAAFGSYGFWPVPGDYDGGGKADAMIYSRADAVWYWVNPETMGLRSVTGFGGLTHIPVPGDYDGDRKSDLALYDYDNGNWDIWSPNTGAWIAQGANFGGSAYLPVPGDYNGGGKSDAVVYAEAAGIWLIYYTETGEIRVVNGLGGPGYVAAPGDYDGDRKTDLGVYNYNNGKWYVYSLANSSMLVNGIQWGGPSYYPVAGDYDGDGKADLVVFSRTASSWYVYYIKDGSTRQINCGFDQYVVPVVYYPLYFYL